MYRQNQPSHPKKSRLEQVSQQHRAGTRKSSGSKSVSTKSKILKSQQPRQQQVRHLPPHHAAPGWLRSLLAMQNFSMVLFGSVFGLSSIVYGYTMHTQTTWRSQQEQLKRWQNQERQQAVMNENLKQQMAETAEQPGSGLVEPKPDRMIFIHSAPPRQPKLRPNTARTSQSKPVSKLPLGY
jgi:hypothetical protein